MTESGKLIAAYEKTRDKLTEKLKTAATASAKQYYKKMLEDIDKAIKELAGSASRYVGAAVPLEYLQNAQQIYSSVRAQGIQMQPPAAFKQQHSDAVADLRREVQSQLEKGVVKAQEQSAALAVDAYKATLRKIGLDAAQQKIDTVGTISDMQNDVKKRLEDEGILKVSVGSGEKAREMSITNYANLVARSTSREVGNTARINQLELNGFDLVEIPAHYPTCEICAILQNRVYSISGKDKRFPPLSRAFSGGYKNIHPNCRHVLVAWIESMHTTEEVEEAIKNSNRSWEDPRTGEEVKFYNDLQTKARRARDLRAQYERYKERLGADAPKSLYAFKRMKNADGEKWENLQSQYRLRQEESVKISEKSETNKYSVDRKLVNSKKFHDAFENLPLPKDTKEAAYNESKIILEHRDGTCFENVTVIDAKTGENVVNNNTYEVEFKSAMTEYEYKKMQECKNKVVLIHNHAEGTRPSKTDIFTAYSENKVEASIVAGHDGSVHCIYDIDRNVDIDKIYKDVYNEAIKKYDNKDLATIKATDALYESGAFKYYIVKKE